MPRSSSCLLDWMTLRAVSAEAGVDPRTTQKFLAAAPRRLGRPRCVDRGARIAAALIARGLGHLIPGAQ